MSELTEHAKQKLQDELKNFTGDMKERSVSKDTCKVLCSFCDEEPFAQAVWDNGQTLSDCCKAVMSQLRNGTSDEAVYRAAVKFYMPEAEMKFWTELILPGTDTADKQEPSTAKSGKIIDLLNLL